MFVCFNYILYIFFYKNLIITDFLKISEFKKKNFEDVFYINPSISFQISVYNLMNSLRLTFSFDSVS